VKKYSVSIFLFIHVTLAFINAARFPIPEMHPSSTIAKPNTYFGTGFTHKNSEIELYVIQGAAALQSYSGFQKLFAYLTNGIKRMGRPVRSSSSSILTSDNLFIEGYLTHIYPFHSFW
jgi:hypothetical protein